jgi:hypoxanthine phosphoribosyltransferase
MKHSRQPGNPESSTPCEYISWEHFHRLARDLAMTMRDSGFQPDMIVAIARGGYLPARILSDYLGIFDLVSVKVEHYHGIHKERVAKVRYPLGANIDGKRLLLVDDVSDSGDTFEVATRHLQRQGTPEALMTAVLHHKRTSAFVPDYFVEEVVNWRWIIYPWAVIEDLTSLLQKMKPRPGSVAAFDRQLRERHGIALPQQTLEDVLPAGSRC